MSSIVKKYMNADEVVNFTQENLDNLEVLIDTLKNTSKKKGYATLYDGQTDCYCALGVYASEKLDVKDDDLEDDVDVVYTKLLSKLGEGLTVLVYSINDDANSADFKDVTSTLSELVQELKEL